jgi:hypothetical protein
MQTAPSASQSIDLHSDTLTDEPENTDDVISDVTEQTYVTKDHIAVSHKITTICATGVEENITLPINIVQSFTLLKEAL